MQTRNHVGDQGKKGATGLQPTKNKPLTSTARDQVVYCIEGKGRGRVKGRKERQRSNHGNKKKKKKSKKNKSKRKYELLEGWDGEGSLKEGVSPTQWGGHQEISSWKEVESLPEIDAL